MTEDREGEGKMDGVDFWYRDDEVAYQVGAKAGQRDNWFGIRLFARPSRPGEGEIALVRGYNDSWEETAERRLTSFRGKG